MSRSLSLRSDDLHVTDSPPLLQHHGLDLLLVRRRVHRRTRLRHSLDRRLLPLGNRNARKPLGPAQRLLRRLLELPRLDLRERRAFLSRR